MKVGETVKVRFIGSNSGFIHPMHIHGGPFEVVARDGETLAPAARFRADTINIGPGQRYDVIWTPLKPGQWMIHCHISQHTTNNKTDTTGGSGLMMHTEAAGGPTTCRILHPKRTATWPIHKPRHGLTSHPPT